MNVALQNIIQKMRVPFLGRGSGPAHHPYGEQAGHSFANRGEQVVHFATSGSAGYMHNGKYVDISGARIGEGEFVEIIVGAGLPDLLENKAEE